jgi:hypothetical protein
MARRANSSKQLQEIRGRAVINGRQPAVSIAALYSMQFRSAGRRVPMPKRRLAIAIECEPTAEIPQPVKIVKVD